MIFIKTNDVNDVVFCHTDPFHETYGLGKTEEELRAEGFLVDYLKELPTAEKRKGYRGITCFGENKFWFRYEEQALTPEEQYIEQMSIIQEKQEKHEKTIKAQQEENALLKQEIEQLGYNIDTSITYAGDAHNKADQTLQETARMTMELMFKEEAIQNQEAELIGQKSLMDEQKKVLDSQQAMVTSMTQDLVIEKAKILAQKQEMQATIEESAMMTMALMDMDYTMLKTKEATDKVVLSIKETEAFVEKTKNEVIVLKDEVALGTNESATITMAMLEIDMKLNDKQLAIDEIKKNIATIKEVQGSLIATIKEVQVNLLRQIGNIEVTQLEVKAFKDEMAAKVTKLLDDQTSMLAMYTESKNGLEAVRRDFEYYESEKTVMRSDIERLKKEKSAFETGINEMVLQDANELVKTKAELASTKAQLDELQTNVVELTRRLNEGGIA